MLKQASKSNKITQVRDFKTKRLIQGIGTRDTKRQSMFDIQAKLKSSVGVLRMNREHRFNTLTPGFASQVSRGVETMDMDHTVKLIYLTTAEGKHFSNGTDFRTMLHLRADGKDEKVASYVEDLYRLQTTFAKINKPIMSVAPGHSFNSGAGLLAASGLPAICHDSKIAFNEVTFGYVPHAGSTYYCSRLPGDFGTFLLLTGWPVTGKDAIKLGMADSLIEVPESYEHEVFEIGQAMDPTSMPTSARALGYEGFGIDRPNPATEASYLRAKQIDQQDQDDVSELRKRLGVYIHDEPFVDPNERKPDVVAQADLAYKKMLKDWNNARYDQGGQGYFDHGADGFNQFAYIQNYVRLHAGHIFKDNSVSTLLQHSEMIDRCFWHNSIEDIMDALRRETHPFAKEILQKMECNSMLSMKLALKMLRQSKNMAYGEILKMEMNVALNKTQDSDFELGVKEVLMKPTKVSRLGMRPNPGFKTEVSDLEVESYFRDNKHASKIDLDIVENSLLPTRHFFERFPDSMRVYINETSSPQEEIRDAVKYEINELLRAEGIDIRDKTVTIPMAREWIDKKLKKENQMIELFRRSEQMITDKKLRQWYFEGINKQLLKLEDKKEFYSLVNDKIQKIFEQAYFQRLNLIYEKSKEAQSLEKRRMFIRMKKFLIKSRIMGYVSEETERLTKQVEALPFKMIHLTEKWDQSHRDIDHPELQKSVMYHLSKVVGKASLAPPEMIKTYLTDPDAAKSMQAYTFDKRELEKLQKDLFTNPEKYQEMLKQDFEQDDWLYGKDYGRFFEKKRRQMARQEYEYNLQNDGRLHPEENFPMRVEYFKYKQWMDEIKNKAIDTLKYSVNRLLVDFENDKDVGNKTLEFSKDKKETKRDALTRLLTQLNEHQETKSLKSGPPKKNILKQLKRPLSKIEKDFESMINSDKELSKLFGKSSVENEHVAGLRQGMMDELLQLVETALLKDADMSKEELETRLAQVMSPSNMEHDKTASLNMIDSYLSDKHGKSVLKATVEKVKPFFLQIYQEKLKEEMEFVIDSFRGQENSNDVLEFYLTYKQDPSAWKNSKAMKKMENFHEELISRQNHEILDPLNSKRFAMRNVLNSFGMGKGFKDAKSPKEYLAATRKEQKEMAEYTRLQGLVEQEIATEMQFKRERELNTQYDENHDLLNNPVFYQSMTQEDWDDIEMLAMKMSDTQDFIEKHQHEITTIFSEADWMEVYSKAILEYGMDMDHVVHATTEEPHIKVQEDWIELAEYAKYLKDITLHQTSEQDYNKVIDFMAETDQGTDEVTRESMFRGLIKKDNQFVANRDDLLKAKVVDQSLIAKAKSDNGKRAVETMRLAKFAPKEVKDAIEEVVQNQSKYIDYRSIQDYLLDKDWSVDFNIKDFINRDELVKDILFNGSLQEFIKQYKDSKLDVVSLSEIQVMVNESQDGMKNSRDKELFAQIETILEHVEDQLSCVSNNRRSQITLGDFLSKHHHMNGRAYRHYSSELLKSQIENALGQGSQDSAACVDYEFGGVISQNIDQETQIDTTLRDFAYGRADNSSMETTHIIDEKGVKSEFSSDVKVVYEEARKATALTSEMETLKNMYENKLLKEYTKEKYDPKVIEGLVQDYMNIRVKDCQIKQNFSKGMNSKYSHIYMRTVQERIMDELKLDEGTNIDEFNWLALNQEEVKTHDPNSKYNLNHFNNDEAIGYRNLEQRSKNPELNKEIAHESVFDEMLADYFLQKRGDYKKGNKLMSDLEKQFDFKIEKGHLASEGENTLGYHYLSQSVGKDESPELIPYNFPALMELDIAVNKQLHNNMGGLSNALRAMGDDDFLIPEFYDTYDVRKPADLYVKDKLQCILNELFDARRKLEKNLSRGELVAYDKVLAKYLTHDNLYSKLKREIYKDYNELEQFNQMKSHEKDNVRNLEKQLLKTRNLQPEFNKGVINEDAFYKHLAYSGLLEKKRRDNRKETVEDPVLQAGYHTFENYYQDQLFEDAKRPAREIDPAAFAPKKKMRTTSGSDRKEHGYLDNAAKRDLFLDEHLLYKENKLEQTERIETFYVLEQFFEQQRKNPVKDKSDPLYQAQEHIRDYFNDPENTHFFDKNRIH